MFDTDIDFDALVKGMDFSDIDIPVRLPEKIATLEKQWENSTADFPAHEFQQDYSRLLAAEQKVTAQDDRYKKLLALAEVEQICEDITNKYRDFLTLEDISEIGEYQNSILAKHEVLKSILQCDRDYQEVSKSKKSDDRIGPAAALYRHYVRLLRITEEFSTYLNLEFYATLKQLCLEIVDDYQLQELLIENKWNSSGENPHCFEFYVGAMDVVAKAILRAIEIVEANRKWDEELERDASEGKLDKLVQAAIADAEAGDSWEI